MRALTVAVLTYQRAELLPTLLDDLDREIGQLATTDRARLLVVDNDPAASAERAVLGQQTRAPLHYVVEARRGIAAARNRVLSECAGEDVLVFVDDDERPDAGWLATLLDTYDTLRPAAVSGPVRTVFLGEPHPWTAAGRFVDRSHRDGVLTGTKLDEAATNNLLLDLATVRRLGLRFDESVQLSGGEDAIFTRQLTAAGGLLVWCAEAWVTDFRPGARTTRRALLRRAYSFANAAVLVRVRLAQGLRGRARVRLAAVAGGVARLGAGIASFLLGALTGRLNWRANGARLAARGAGTLAAGLGQRYEEYRTAPEPANSPAAQH